MVDTWGPMAATSAGDGSGAFWTHATTTANIKFPTLAHQERHLAYATEAARYAARPVDNPLWPIAPAAIGGPPGAQQQRFVGDLVFWDPVLHMPVCSFNGCKKSVAFAGEMPLIGVLGTNGSIDETVLGQTAVLFTSGGVEIRGVHAAEFDVGQEIFWAPPARDHSVMHLRIPGREPSRLTPEFVKRDTLIARLRADEDRESFFAAAAEGTEPDLAAHRIEEPAFAELTTKQKRAVAAREAFIGFMHGGDRWAANAAAGGVDIGELAPFAGVAIPVDPCAMPVAMQPPAVAAIGGHIRAMGAHERVVKLARALEVYSECTAVDVAPFYIGRTLKASGVNGAVRVALRT